MVNLPKFVRILIILTVEFSMVKSINDNKHQRYEYVLPSKYGLAEVPRLNYYNHETNHNNNYHYNDGKDNGNGNIFNYKILLYDHRNGLIDPNKGTVNGYYKKPKTKYYLKHTSGSSKLRSSLKADADNNKNCCGNEWLYLVDKIRDPSSYYNANNNDHNYLRQQFDEIPNVTPYITSTTVNGRVYPHQHEGADIKPVVEHIEGDLKYDFRTNTHSY